MSKPVIASKSSRGTAWQHQAAASSLSAGAPAHHASESTEIKGSNTASTPSCQDTCTSETAGFWYNAFQSVCKGPSQPLNPLEISKEDIT